MLEEFLSFLQMPVINDTQLWEMTILVVVLFTFCIIVMRRMF